MPSKPIIDILAGVTTYDEFDLMVHRLATIGYLHTGVRCRRPSPAAPM
jgi:GrpB-like predicted nucleotidyltransferase (UPF0157 family)